MWLVLSFLTAIFTSAQDIISKRVSTRVSPYVTTWAVSFFSIPFSAVLLFWEKPAVHDPVFWVALAATTVTLTTASVYFFKAIEASDLTLSIPLLSFTPLMLLVTSPLIVGEFPKPLGIVGMVLTVLGCYILFYHPDQEDILAPFRRLIKARGSRYMLIVAILYSIGANVDKLGMKASSPLLWSLSLNSAVSVVAAILMLVKVRQPLRQIKPVWGWLVLLGFFMALSFFVQMHALKIAIVPYVIAVKRTSIILTALWGVWFLKEKGGRERLLAVLLMVAGVFIISFAH
ncbi:MAG: EamA family transporter [Candidatus Omnitrophica bacterium]|nr:EamA family transporter [Candidatus Omnitrophota bacterium]